MTSINDLHKSVLTKILEKTSPKSGVRMIAQLGREDIESFKDEIKKLKKWYDNIPTSDEIIAATNEFLKNAKVTLRKGDPFVYSDPLFNDNMDLDVEDDDDDSIIPILDMSYNGIMYSAIYPNTVSHDVYIGNCAYEKKMFGKLEIRDNNTYRLTLAGEENTMVNVEVLKVFLGMPFVLPAKLEDNDWVITQKGLRRMLARRFVSQSLPIVNATFTTNVEDMVFTSAAQLHPLTTRLPKNNDAIRTLI